MDDCIFCRIAAGEVPSQKLYEDERVLAFRDVSPQAPTHVLVIPKEHTPNAATCVASDPALLGQLFARAAQLAIELGLQDEGFRLVTNCGTHGAQSVEHFHIHILGGAQLDAKLG